MKQIAIVSGKGGTGKTTLVGALENLFHNHVMVDCDVDAANLHLYFKPEIKEKFDFYGGEKAYIDSKLCINCGICKRVCRFDAVIPECGDSYCIDPYACEGCNACVLKCPVNAITLQQEKAGEYYLSEINGIPLVHAHLKAGEDNSGGLVAEVRKKAVEVAKEGTYDYVIIDGSPGIGCPATSSIMGVQYVVIVTEPTQSGIHDLERIIETIGQYRLRFGIVINKWDINRKKSREIEQYCEANEYDLLGKMEFDETVVKATMEGKSIIQYPDSAVAKSIKEIYQKLLILSDVKKANLK